MADEPGMPGERGPDGGERPGRHHGAMGVMDADKDGAIQKNEFGGRRAERLKAADANGDGTLSADELEAMVVKEMAERRVARMMKRLDVDGDGKVTLAEVETMRAKRFALMDRNDDGKIDRRELAEIHRGVEGMDGHRREGGRHADRRDGERGHHDGHGMRRHDEKHGGERMHGEH